MNAGIFRGLIIAITMLTTPAAYAQRNVVVNGFVLNATELRQLDQAACANVPDGNYWLNMQTGAWGYAGNSMQQGYIADNCKRRPSLSERRQLYRPGEILSQDRFGQ